MRLLFSSSHRGLVDRMGKRFAQAGIPCEIRYRLEPGGFNSDYRELWIQTENEMQWALLAFGQALRRQAELSFHPRSR